MNIRTFLLILFAAVTFAECANADDSTSEVVSLASLPSVYSEEYKVDPYIEAASKLQGLGEEAAIKELIRLSRSPLAEAEKRMEEGGGEKAVKEADDIRRSSKSSVLDERGKIVILCRMLFTPRGTNFEEAGLGGLTFLGDNGRTTMNSEGAIFKKWPLEPIELVDGIPFLVVDGWVYEGWCDPRGAEHFVRHCATAGYDWSATRFVMKTKEQKEVALRKLIGSPKWEQPLGESERDFLGKELQ